MSFRKVVSDFFRCMFSRSAKSGCGLWEARFGLRAAFALLTLLGFFAPAGKRAEPALERTAFMDRFFRILRNRGENSEAQFSHFSSRPLFVPIADWSMEGLLCVELFCGLRLSCVKECE